MGEYTEKEFVNDGRITRNEANTEFNYGADSSLKTYFPTGDILTGSDDGNSYDKLADWCAKCLPNEI